MRIVGFILFMTLALSPRKLHGQHSDTSYAGKLQGVAFDSMHNYTLRSATVAIYISKDTTNPISYQLTNNLGEFHFTNLPVAVSLKVIISYTGYIPKVKICTIQAPKTLDLGKINLLPALEMDAVEVIYTPPVRMNKDTLEFNANAFKMGENDVVEDLLRKLPGVVLWGDGTITVNGREVKNVTVNGKPFFGSTSKVAIQNIPKNIVDKIQVYQQRSQPDNTMDSVTMVNIKLKKGSDRGLFGKGSAGGGTDDKYESTVNINFFTPRTQLAIVGAANNVNKIANNTATLLEISTFKETGPETVYLPEFSMSGLNRTVESGLSFQHDFSESSNTLHSNRLTAAYFLQNNNADIISNTRTTTVLQQDSMLYLDADYTNKGTKTYQTFNAAYENRNYDKVLNLNISFKDDQGRNSTRSLNNALQNNTALVSNNALTTNSNYHNSTFSLSGMHQNKFTNNAVFTGNPILRFNYAFGAGRNRNDQLQESIFNSHDAPSTNQFFNRNYKAETKNYTGALIINADNLWNIRMNGLQLASVGIGNDLSATSTDRDNIIYDIDSTSGEYRINNLLTNHQQYTVVNEMPFLKLRKNISKSLSDRYARSLDINFLIREQIMYQESVSEKGFQQFKRTHQQFTPEVDVQYTFMRLGSFQNSYRAKFFKLSYLPGLDQLFTLKDSINIYNIFIGNPKLESYHRTEIVFDMSHMPLSNKSQFNYSMSFKIGAINNYITDSTLIDTDRKTLTVPVNINGHKYLNATLKVNKGFRIREQSLQLIVANSFDLYNRPNYLNSILRKPRILSNNLDLSIYYYANKYLSFQIEQLFSYYQSKEKGLWQNQFRYLLSRSTASVSSSITEKLIVKSAIAINANHSTNSDPIKSVIWNTNASYRFLKKNNAEIKISAFDLLHQNLNIINYGTSNSLTVGTNNVLQQYFMITLSYFPRKFKDQ